MQSQPRTSEATHQLRAGNNPRKTSTKPTLRYVGYFFGDAMVLVGPRYGLEGCPRWVGELASRHGGGSGGTQAPGKCRFWLIVWSDRKRSSLKTWLISKHRDLNNGRNKGGRNWPKSESRKPTRIRRMTQNWPSSPKSTKASQVQSSNAHLKNSSKTLRKTF